jgi:hypothetical protein
MIAVIQCASSKRPAAGHLLKGDGERVIFVAHPETAPADSGYIYARPDDKSDGAQSWREVLLKYNDTQASNPLGLLPAYRLYENATYGRLVERFGVEKVFILSAGWGLIRADFLTPYYDITFSAIARGRDAYKRRMKVDKYCDLCMLSDDTDEELIFFGGKDYVPLFCTLTSRVKGKRTIFHSAAQAPQAPGCVTVKFETTTRTNWHYECARAFLKRI